MDTQEHQIKKTLSGRESHGVYTCNKCGWPFPKAHPSSKHRRAHKKVCGTIEGYKVFESDDPLVASDGEHALGEAEQTQSPVVDKIGVNELGSSGRIDLQSNRSADDVFSDAVAEFSDGVASPAIGDLIKDLSNDMEKLVHSDPVEDNSFGDNSIAPLRSIKTSNPEVDERVTNELEKANSSSSEARFEDSPVGSGVTALQFDTSPVALETPDVLIEGTDTVVKDEDLHKTLTHCLNLEVESTRKSPEPYVNEIDKQASDNLREEESLTPVADTEKQSKLEAEENIFLDFVTQHILVENDIPPPQNHLDTENSVTQIDSNKIGEQSEVQRIVEQSGKGNDMHVSLLKTKEEETTVSSLEGQTQADIAVYSLSMPDSLAGIANAAHLIEDFKDYASSPELSFPLDLWSVGDDKQSTVGGQSVSGFGSVDSSGGINSSATDQNSLKDNYSEKEVEKPIRDKSCVSGSLEESVKDHGSYSLNSQPELPDEAESVGIYDWLQKLDSEIALTNESNAMSPVLIGNSEETTNHVEGDDPDQNKLSKFEESDEDIKQCSKGPMEDQLVTNDKRTQGTDSLFLLDDNQITSSLKVNQSQVLKEAAVELSERHESSEPTQKRSDVDVQQSASDSRGNMEQVEYMLSQIGTGNVTDYTGSFSSAEKNVEGNHNDWILLSSENKGTFITNELGPLHEGSEFLQTKGDETGFAASAVKNDEGNHNEWILLSSEDQGIITNEVGPLPVGSESLQGKGDEKLETRFDGASVSIASSSRADSSMDGNWGSVSAVSLQSDTAATPSSMKLVEPGNDVPQRATPSDLSALSTQQQNDEDQKASWFPSVSNLVNELQARKRNEIIAQGSNGSPRREHSPLKSLLGEARSPSSKQVSSVSQKDEISTKSSGAGVTTVDAILRSEPNDKDIEKEWDSPARYPVEIKKEKRKKKAYWVPFVCCSSVQRDL